MQFSLIKKISDYGSLVKFSHSIFAMPFALVGFSYAYSSSGAELDLIILIKIVVCMILARNAAMTFNRYVDRKIDAKNSRTKNREIPSGVISARAALVFCIVNCVLFMATSSRINLLCFYLSPIALAVILGYSYTKRFTSMCHLVLGLGLAIAPTGAYIAVCGSFALVPILLSILVLTWVSGFDIIYALQDAEFDRNNSLNSIPSKFGIAKALKISTFLHIITIALVVLIAFYIGSGVLYIVGAAIFSLLMIYQHMIVKADDISRVDMAFGTVNGIASLIYGVFTIAGLLI